MDKRFQVYRARFGDGRFAHDLIAFYGPILEPEDDERVPMVRCVMATEYGRDPAVKENLVSLEVRQRFTHEVTERWGRHLHPRLYAYLDPCEGYSTLVVVRHGKSQARLEFAGCPALYCGFGWSSRRVGFHRAPLLGTAQTIEQIKAQVLAQPQRFTLDQDILPATPRNFSFAIHYHTPSWGSITTKDIKAYLVR